MKYLKILAISTLAVFALSCNSDNAINLDDSNGSVEVQQAISSEMMKALINETKNNLKISLESAGFKDIYDESLVVGNLNGNKLKISSKKINEILGFHFKLIAQNGGYNASFNEFEFLNAKDNNGNAMLISKGLTNVNGESISIGVNLNFNKIGSLNLSRAGTLVLCTGCEKGCSPRRDASGDGWCTDCTVASSGPSGWSCVKTETLPPEDTEN